MPSHTPMPQVTRLEVIETGARRRWTLEEKQRIVAESFSAPRVVSATARHHGLSNSLLFHWRRQAREGKLVGKDEVPGFVPAIVAADDPRAVRVAVTQSAPSDGSGAGPSGGRIEIVLSDGCRVIVGNDVDAAALGLVLAAVRRP